MLFTADHNAPSSTELLVRQQFPTTVAADVFVLSIAATAQTYTAASQQLLTRVCQALAWAVEDDIHAAQADKLPAVALTLISGTALACRDLALRLDALARHKLSGTATVALDRDAQTALAQFAGLDATHSLTAPFDTTVAASNLVFGTHAV